MRHESYRSALGGALGARIRELRWEAQETQLELAIYLGVSQGSISNYEAGKRDVSSWLLLDIVQHYGFALALFAVDRRHVDRVHQVSKTGWSLCREYISLTPALDPHARLRMTSAVTCPGCRDVYDAKHAVGRNVRGAA